MVGGGSLGENLGVGEGSRDKGDGDGAVFLVGDVDDGAGGLAVDEAQAEDVGVGEGYFDVGFEFGGGVGDGGSLRGIILSVVLETLKVSRDVRLNVPELRRQWQQPGKEGKT